MATMKKISLTLIFLFAALSSWAEGPKSEPSPDEKKYSKPGSFDSCFPPFNPNDEELFDWIKINRSILRKLRVNLLIGVVTDGRFAVGFGLSNYYFETGIQCAINIIDRRTESHIYFPAVFLGARYFVSTRTCFAFGASLNENFGKISQRKIKLSLTPGFYITLERFLTNNFMIGFRINYYQFQYQKLKGLKSQRTHRIFDSGGLGVSYLF